MINVDEINRIAQRSIEDALRNLLNRSVRVDPHTGCIAETEADAIDASLPPCVCVDRLRPVLDGTITLMAR